jgi:di/tricarboxylate transporter
MKSVLTPFFCVALPVTIFFLPSQMQPAASKALAISVGMVLFWIFLPVHHAITGLMGCFLYWATGAVNFETAFNGFAQDTPWFLYGAIILGTVAARTGLARRLPMVLRLPPVRSPDDCGLLGSCNVVVST